MAWTDGPDFSGAASLIGRLRARFGPVAVVIADHALLCSLVSSGLRGVVAELPLH